MQARAATETDIEDFQREKQAALNELDVLVLLHAHQIEYLVDGKLPTDLSGALVFSNAELARLRSRIDVRDCQFLFCCCHGCSSACKACLYELHACALCILSGYLLSLTQSCVC